MTYSNTTVSVRLGPLKKELQQIAERKDKTLSQLIKDWLEQMANQEKPANPLANFEGIDDARVPEGDKQAYVNSFKTSNNTDREKSLYDILNRH